MDQTAAYSSILLILQINSIFCSLNVDEECTKKSPAKWTIVLNAMAYGGKRMQGNSPEKCKINCIAKASCTGFDLSFRTKCWMHTSNNYQSDIVRNVADTVAYALDRYCGLCKANWTVHEHSMSLFGEEMPTLSGYDACSAACEKDASCEGFDLMPDNTCRRHRDPRHAHAIVGRDAHVNAYRIFRYGACDPGCVTGEWIERKRTRYRWKTTVYGTTGVKRCRIQCLRAPRCLGFDFEIETKRCLQHFSLNVFTVYYDSGDFNQHLLLKRDATPCYPPPPEIPPDKRYPGLIRRKKSAGDKPRIRESIRANVTTTSSKYKKDKNLKGSSRKLKAKNNAGDKRNHGLLRAWFVVMLCDLVPTHILGQLAGKF